MNFLQPRVILSMPHTLFSGSTLDPGARLLFQKKIKSRCLKIGVINVPKIVSIIVHILQKRSLVKLDIFCNFHEFFMFCDISYNIKYIFKI